MNNTTQATPKNTTDTTCKKCGGQMAITTIGTLMDKILKCSYCNHTVDIPDSFAIKEINETDYLKNSTGQKIKKKTTTIKYRTDEMLDGNELSKITDSFMNEPQASKEDNNKQTLIQNSYKTGDLPLEIPMQGTREEVRAAIIQHQENNPDKNPPLSDEAVDSLTNSFMEMMADKNTHMEELTKIYVEEYKRTLKEMSDAHLARQEAIIAKYNINQETAYSVSKDFFEFINQETTKMGLGDLSTEEFYSEETRKAFIPRIEEFKKGSKEKYGDSINEELLDNITEMIFLMMDISQISSNISEDKTLVYMQEEEITHEPAQNPLPIHKFFTFTVLMFFAIGLVMLATMIIGFAIM